MTKTAAEWQEEILLGPSPGMKAITQADIQAIINDARAGMVPEVELIRAQLRLVEHEAELAKAWEAAATAQRESDKDAVYHYCVSRTKWELHDAVYAIENGPLVQPPGGKAK